MGRLRGGSLTRRVEAEASRSGGGLPTRGDEEDASRDGGGLSTRRGRVVDPPSRSEAGRGGGLAASRNPDPSEESMATEVEAQIAGSLWKIEKVVGDAVEANDVIMIIESM